MSLVRAEKLTKDYQAGEIVVHRLDHPSEGRLSVLDTDVSSLNRHAAAEFRGQHIGFVFQDFNLLPVLTAYENVEHP